MDVLVRKDDKAVVRAWRNGTTGRVPHPEKPHGALTMGAGTERPLDLGDWLLVRASGDEPVAGTDYNPATQVAEGPTLTVNDDLTVDAAWTIRDKTQKELDADARAAAFSELAQITVPRLVEVVDDLVATLEAKGTLALADLPQEAQDTVNRVRELRKKL